MFLVKVMSYREALEYVYTYSGLRKYPKYAIISIQEPTYGYGIGLEMKVGGNCLAALNIEFGDVTPAMIKETDNDSNEIKHQLMTMKQAHRIHDFVETLPKEVQLLIVHCSAGISRSAGVAAAILKAKTNDDSQIFSSDRYVPNMYVYYNILEAYGLTNRYQTDIFDNEYNKIWNSEKRMSIDLHEL